MVHIPHFDNCKASQKDGIKKHEHTPGKTFLNGIQIVGKQTHQVPYFVHLIIFTTQILGVVKHTVSKVRFHFDTHAEKCNTPQETTKYHGQNNPHHRHTDFIQQESQIKYFLHTVHFHKSRVHAVDNHLVHIRNNKLKPVYDYQRNQPEYQPSCIF